MSSIIYGFTAENAVVGTDTLAVSSEDFSPVMFTTKSFVVPHLKLIISGTGFQGFAGKWFVRINDGIVVRDIDNLDYHTPDTLRKIWRDYSEEHPPDSEASTTIYHFGYSEELKALRGYAYRSKKNFESEELVYGFGIKPECSLLEDLSLPRDLKKMMDEQRIIQATKPENERLYIGGEIIVNELSHEGFSTYTIDKFDDYETVEETIFTNFQNNNPT